MLNYVWRMAKRDSVLFLGECLSKFVLQKLLLFTNDPFLSPPCPTPTKARHSNAFCKKASPPLNKNLTRYKNRRKPLRATFPIGNLYDPHGKLRNRTLLQKWCKNDWIGRFSGFWMSRVAFGICDCSQRFNSRRPEFLFNAAINKNVAPGFESHRLHFL